MSKRRGAKVVDEDPIYVVDRIVDHTKIDGRVMYRIRWKDYSSEEDTSQLEEDLNCPAKLSDYLKQIGDDGVGGGSAVGRRRGRRRGRSAPRGQKRRWKVGVREVIPESGGEWRVTPDGRGVGRGRLPTT